MQKVVRILDRTDQDQICRSRCLHRNSRKNNGTRKGRLVIRKKGEWVVPCIYLRELYQCHEETGDMELCVQMEKQLEDQKEEMPVRNILKTWEEWRGRISFRLINTDWNRNYLKSVPHKKFLDYRFCANFELSKYVKRGKLKI